MILEFSPLQVDLLNLESPQSKFEANRSRGSRVMIGHYKQTNKDYYFINIDNGIKVSERLQLGDSLGDNFVIVFHF